MRLNALIIIRIITAGIIIISCFFNPFTSQKSDDVIEIDINLNADRYGNLKVFFANEKGAFSESNSRNVAYPPNTSGHRIAITSAGLDQPIRLDPSAENAAFTQITSITTRRQHLSKTYAGKDLKRVLIRCANADCQLSKDGIDSLATSNDAQIYLHPSIIPFNTKISIIVAIISAFTLLFILQTLIEYTLSRGMYPGTLVFIAIAIILLIASFTPDRDYPIYVMTALVILTLRLSLVPYQKTDTFMRSLPAKGYLVISTAFFAFWVLLTYTAILPLAYFTSQFTNAEDTNYKGVIERTWRSHLYNSNKLMNADAEFKVFKFGMTPNPKTLIGKENWFFEGYGERKIEAGINGNFDNVSDFLGLSPFSKSELEHWRLLLEDRYYWLKDRGIDYLFAFAPVKAEIYPEYMPENLLVLKKKINQPNRYDQLVAYLKEHSDIPMVALKEPLMKAKETANEKLYYRTDFHWNFLAGLYAYQEIMHALGPKYANAKNPILRVEDFKMEVRRDWAHERFLTLAGLNPANHQDDTSIKMVPISRDHFLEDSPLQQGLSRETIPYPQKYPLKNGRAPHLAKLINENKIRQRMLIVGDSFSEVFAMYMSAHANETIIHRSVLKFPIALIKEFNPELVVQETLSMYLLTKVPQNPKSIRGAKKRYLTKHGQDTE